MNALLSQMKAKRKAMGFRQEDMATRVGMSRQQYQRLEQKGNPRLDTLELMAKGLQSELVLIPREKLGLVRQLLGANTHDAVGVAEDAPLYDDPWRDILGDVE